MPDVRITNPEVKIDLNDGETTTVPSGERWIVDIFADGSSGTRLENSAGQEFLGIINTREERARLSDGDTIRATSSTRTAIRGDVVST